MPAHRERGPAPTPTADHPSARPARWLSPASSARRSNGTTSSFRHRRRPDLQPGLLPVLRSGDRDARRFRFVLRRVHREAVRRRRLRSFVATHATFYIASVWLISPTTKVGYDRTTILNANTALSLSDVPMILGFGLLSDYIARRKLF